MEERTQIVDVQLRLLQRSEVAADGLAAYLDNPAHQRAKLLELTRTGRAALRTIQRAQRSWADSLGADVGERELRAASRTLDHARAALEAAHAVAEITAPPRHD